MTVSEELLAALHSEFHRLNTAYFDNALPLPEISLSRRKTFGGYYQPHRHRIVLSLQAYQEHGWEEVVNTFRHEVAHIVHQNHSKAFWELARTLGVSKQYAAAPLTPPRTPHKYVYLCPSCSRRVYRNRRLRLSSCASCDRAFNPRHILRLIENPSKANTPRNWEA